MSRVRIYELAKEAGMSNKLFVEKLVEHGFDIKSHSSSVDDETAQRIRKTVLHSSPAAAKEVEKRGRVEDVVDETPKRRTTVIRRRPKQEILPEEGELAPALEAREAGSEQGEAPLLSTDEAAPKHEEPAHISSLQGAEGEQTIAPREAADELGAPEGAHPDQDVVSASAVRMGKGDEGGDRPEPSRKGLARVVGSIVIPVREEEAPRSVRPKGKMVRTDGLVPPVTSVPGIVDAEGSAGDLAARGKKKSRFAELAAEEEARRKAGKKPGKKERQKVMITRFGEEYSRHQGKRGKKSAMARKMSQPIAEMKAIKKRIKVYETITVGDLSHRMGIKANEAISKLMGMGVLATLNQALDVDTATLIAADFGYEVEQGHTEEIGVLQLNVDEGGGEALSRPPVVTVMGHVDHGKTSILDAIRKTDVAAGEAGGITQHIGAYHVTSSAGDVTFVDTPGHAAFTEMRSRGAKITDLVVLVVAADDGVMDQTREAIHHAQAAEVPILVAVNKIDKPNADPDRVKRELSDLNLMPEEWGGQTIFCETSAKNNQGITELLEHIQLLAEMLELKADPNRKARGRVVEAKLDKGRGAVATVLVQEGTLRPGDYFVVGQFSGKVRGLLDDKSNQVKAAGPSMPVEVQGLTGVPSAGDEFIVVTDEKMAKAVSQARILKARESELASESKVSLDRLFEKMNEGEVQELRVILRADVQGTLEAFGKAAEQLSTDAVKVKVLHEGTGTITDTDVLLASASQAIIIGFNVRPSAKIKDLAEKENVDLRSYDVIYHALDDIRKAMVGMLEPTFEEEVIGNAEVRETFHVPKVGTIAGCSVTTGKIARNAGVRVVRDGVVMYTGKISSLKRFKDDAKEVLTGYECGIAIENFNDIKLGDNLEAFVMKKVEATLDS